MVAILFLERVKSHIIVVSHWNTKHTVMLILGLYDATHNHWQYEKYSIHMENED